MNILAIDTAAGILSLALGTEAGIWSAASDAGQRHSEMLMDMAESLIKNAGLSPGDLDGVACMKGPGSFTGLRIGFSAAKGIALALGIPLAASPTLDCMTVPYASWPDLILPVMDARKRRFFTALYRGNRRRSEFMDAAVPEIALRISGHIGSGKENHAERIIITGDDAEMIYEDLLSACRSLMPDTPLLLKANSGRRGWGVELLEMVKKSIFDNSADERTGGPEYIRKSDAELNFENKAGLYGRS
ncbi:MAG: tRNA (adenosine(37)-N6)-threonylcarbamoyltransferase complex dimerization subunit type 1 TsaB [Treponema sp.]|nr:tRNA (adenosine(37)-N6)-threonylcarbamoyltransferase complex dimerization subunit type 1 TsaB [Treponema sp.]